MAQPERAMVPRFCSDHVGWANLLLHVAGRAIRTTGEKKRSKRTAAAGVDGAQRWFLCGRETEVAGSFTRASPLVPLGSVDDVAEWNGAAFSCLLFQRGTRRCGRG